MQRERTEKIKQFENELIQQYLKSHTRMTKEMAEDYKKNAINSAFVEMYCSEDKYISKNKELIERSKA